MLQRVRIRIGGEHGQALVLVIAIISLLSVLAVTTTDVVTGGERNADHSVKLQTAFQAAEAGIDNYTSKLVEDHSYFVHDVAGAESTRKASNGTLVAAGAVWPYDLNWTYPNGHDTWLPLPNGYEYNLEITPPSVASSGGITILSTGRPAGDTNLNDWRSIQTVIRPASLADFYRFVDGDVSFGATTSTYGQIYANGSVTHDGDYYANIYAYGGYSGGAKGHGNATVYSGATAVKTALPDAPINFNQFLSSLSDILNAANNGATPPTTSSGPQYFANNSVAAWQLVFNANGTFTAQSCNQTLGKDVAAVTPTCGAASTYPVPTNGAIYSPQTIIISGQVQGRVTVASNNDIDIGGNISYVTPGQDVLGIVAENNVVVAQYAPSPMTWTAAVLAETGTWETYSQDGSHSIMNFTGSSATKLGGSFTMFNTRNYNYDSNLLFLSPPWFPNLSDSYTTLLFRQVPVTP